jgi:hypothetical protein
MIVSEVEVQPNVREVKQRARLLILKVWLNHAKRKTNTTSEAAGRRRSDDCSEDFAAGAISWPRASEYPNRAPQKRRSSCTRRPRHRSRQGSSSVALRPGPDRFLAHLRALGARCGLSLGPSGRGGREDHSSDEDSVHGHSSFRLLPLIRRRYSPARVGQERTLTTALTGIPQTKPRTCLSDRPFLNWLEAQMRGTADLIER